ncbi:MULTISPECIES: GNAT family N-acetyltransferase [Bacillaceae]|uniref:Acetyltransferase n=1 Tax=Alkalicoccobacillus plakortidis TaxID=444060 RepID=A0A9D5DLM5_9BACI|nr:MULTISPECIES: GNAT family N-acetyltransferase [Bacillaceae]KQL56168.1 acetyltransferase [Alkalicoccobacillus plakortidis]
MVVKEATLEDLEGIAQLFNEYRKFYHQEDHLDGAREYVHARLDKGDSVLFMVKEDNAYLGFTQLYPTFSSISMAKAWILNDLYVHKNARGKGVAEALLEEAKAYALETGAVSIALSTAPDNFPAQRLYEKHGYKRDEQFYHYELGLV